jgi:hypothetical protein
MNCNCVFIRFLKALDVNSYELITCGSYFLLADNGGLFNALVEDKCGRPSCSSHRSEGLQYRCSISGLNGVYGTLERKKRLCTWIQLEAYSPFSRPIAHCCSWLNLKITGRQTGPNGYSLKNSAHAVYVSKRDSDYLLSCIKSPLVRTQI